MTITEFLTARYDEDGCGCETNSAGDIRCHRCGERVNVRCWNCKTPRGAEACPMPRSPRILADIAAKRAIVAFAVVVDDLADTIYQEFSSYPDQDGSQLLRLLAQPYAEHPDFDEAWRTA